MMKNILIIEDDKDLSEGLNLALKNHEIKIILAESIAKAKKELARNSINLVVLDINLPDGSGLELLKEIKLSSCIPVILLTANDTEMDVVLGLENGADDYIIKPFSLAILRARVNAQLRRLEQVSSKAIAFDEFHFDFEHMKFTHGEQDVSLSKTEQRLLHLLVANRGKTMSRSMLLESVWDDGAEFVDENTLSVAMKRLRDKLHAGKYIKTVYGIGYVWAVK